jgi:hypothetical protein
MLAEVPMTMAKALTLAAAHAQPIVEARSLGSTAIAHGAISDIAVANGSMIVTTNSGDGRVALLDADSLAVQGMVAVTGEPYAAAVAGERAFVATAAATHDAVSAVDTRATTFLASLPVGLSQLCVAAEHDGRHLFVGGSGSVGAELAIVDVESGRSKSVHVSGGSVDAVRVAPNGRVVYVATSDTDAGHIVFVDPAQARILAKVPTVAPIRDLELSSDGSVAYILGCHTEYGGVVETVDTTTRQVLATAWIGGFPTQFAIEADRMYIVDVDHVAVWCMVTNDVTDTITVAAQPSCAAVRDGRLYVADYSGVVTAFAVPSRSFDDVIDVETLALPQARELAPV